MKNNHGYETTDHQHPPRPQAKSFWSFSPSTMGNITQLEQDRRSWHCPQCTSMHMSFACGYVWIMFGKWSTQLSSFNTTGGGSLVWHKPIADHFGFLNLDPWHPWHPWHPSPLGFPALAKIPRRTSERWPSKLSRSAASATKRWLIWLRIPQTMEKSRDVIETSWFIILVDWLFKGIRLPRILEMN